MLDGQVISSKNAICKLSSLEIRLNKKYSCRGSGNRDPSYGWFIDRCLQCHPRVEKSQPTPITFTDVYIITRWSYFCHHPLANLNASTRLTLISDCEDMVMTKKALAPLKTFPRLKECTIQLSHSYRAKLQALAKNTVLKGTGRRSLAHFGFHVFPRSSR